MFTTMLQQRLRSFKPTDIFDVMTSVRVLYTGTLIIDGDIIDVYPSHPAKPVILNAAHVVSVIQR